MINLGGFTTGPELIGNMLRGGIQGREAEDCTGGYTCDLHELASKYTGEISVSEEAILWRVSKNAEHFKKLREQSDVFRCALLQIALKTSS
jgi:hypothetical protein